MTLDNLNLVTGNPSENENATYTRFTLPFAYHLTEHIAGSGSHDNKFDKDQDLYFAVDPAKDYSFIKRRKYFSREAALVLYSRATWLTMCSNWEKTVWGNKGVNIKLRKRDFTIKMLPPKVILFEANKGEITKEPNILQTGFLYLDIYFPEQANKPILDDLLELNELFRFFGIPYDKHAKDYSTALGKVPTEYTFDDKPRCVEDLILFDKDDELVYDAKETGFKSAYFSRWEKLLNIPALINNKTCQFFGEEWNIKAKQWVYDTYQSPLDEHWQMYADNRAYVWTAAILKNGAKSLQNRYKKNEDWQAHKFGHWVKLLNVDSPSRTPDETHLSTQFEQIWADDRSYKRWEKSGSWYGYSYHCGAMISKVSGWKNVFGLQYFDASMLLFYSRITLFRFNTKLSRILCDTKPKELLKFNKKLRNEFQQLRSEFSFFSILYQTPLLSNQQQALEMYEYNKKYFEIEELYNDVKTQIDETHGLLEQMEAISLGKTANLLARWGIPFAVGGLVTGLFGMSDFKLFEKCSGNVCFSWSNLLAQGGIVLFFTLLTFWLVPFLNKNISGADNK